MKLYLPSTLVRVSPLIFASTLLGKADPALSQASNIVPDDTLGEESSQVIENINGQPIEVITGGAQREQNLFHSFQEFNVSEGRGAYFESPNVDVQNIFSRVTGSNPSEIMGVLGTFGESNPDLYLINPNGIIFGENAALDVQGSFTATTAEEIEFSKGGLFSAVAPGESLLTISVPLGLQFGSSPGSIINRSFVTDNTGDFVGLQVPSGENLTLVGGEIRFEAGEATARGGNIYLAGLGAAGTVGLSDDGSLSFPNNIAKANVDIINFSDVDVRGSGGGNITINAQNLSLEVGTFGRSRIRAGIQPESIDSEAQAGNININVTENIRLNNSSIRNRVNSNEESNLIGIGNSGNILIDAGSLELINGGDIIASTSGQGNAGAIKITATGDITIDGEDSEGFQSAIANQVGDNAEGDTGGVTIFAKDFNLTNGGEVDASTFGRGNAGAIEITATGEITIDGEGRNFPSGINSRVESGAEGDSEGVIISTGNLNLTNGGQIDASTFGQGNAGAIEITATDDIIADGENSRVISSGVSSRVGSGAEGDSGGVTISTTNLNLTRGGGVSAGTQGQGNAGAISVIATGDITADGEDSEGNASGITSLVDFNAEGNAGKVTISTNNLDLKDGARISANTLGRGNAGAIEITATDDITADGERSDGIPSNIASQVGKDAEGNSGGITISTNNLNLSNGGGVSASTVGKGNAGAIKITATSDIIADGEQSGGFQSGVVSAVDFSAEGDSGDVTISTNNLSLTNGGIVSASTFGLGNAGTIEITAIGEITADGEQSKGFPSAITSQVESDAVGDADGVKISTNNLNLTNGGIVSASTFGRGDAGAIEISATGNITADGSDLNGFGSGIVSQVNPNGEGNSGEITISTTNLDLTNGGRISSATLGLGNAGNINIISNFLNIANNGFVSTSTLNQGESGQIQIDTSFLKLSNSSIVSISESDFDAGDITLKIDDSLQTIDSFISASSSQSSGGNLNIAAGDIELRGDSDLATNIASGEGSGGNISIKADSILAFDDSDIFAFAGEGQGGNITLDTPAFFAENFTLNSLTADPDEDQLDLNNRADVNATGAVSGAVDIPDVSFIQNSLTELPNNSLNTDELVANSCVVPAGERNQGRFIITGGDSLPVRPGDNLPSKYPTGEVRGVTKDSTSSWQPGDPIIEPQGAYRLANGKMVLSRECSR